MPVVTSSNVPTILAASVIGQAHVRRGVPCQDAFRTLVGEGAMVVAVADGLGSASHSHLGAAVASEAAATRAMEHADGDTSRAAVEGIVAGREALEELAAVEGCELTDLACTLIVAVAAERLAVAHIGDGAAIALCGDEPYVVSPPGPSEYVNETDSLASDGWIDHVRVVCCMDGVEAFGVFTDGCQHAALRKENGGLRAHSGFFAPLFSFARSGITAEKGDLALGELLGGAKMAEHSDDDKTLVLALLR